MVDVASLLREATPKTEDKIRCQACNADVDEGVDICPRCGEPARLVPLSKYGRKLPIGIIETTPDGTKKLVKDFNVVKLDWKKEREVSSTWKEISKNAESSILDYILCVLACTVESIGGIDFKKHSVERRMYILGEMYSGDVFYMYAYLRVMSIGPEFHFENVRCPSCNNVIVDYPADLSSLEVVAQSEIERITQTVTLRDGFRLGGEIRKKITLQPASFRVLAKAKFDDDAQFFSDVFQSTCVNIDGVDGGVLTEEEIEQMSPYDLALVRSKNDWLAGGIDWSIDVVCPKCKSEFNRIIDWRYGNFFSLSSRLRTMR